MNMNLGLANQMGDGGRRSAPVGYFPTWGLLARIVHSGALSNRPSALRASRLRIPRRGKSAGVSGQAQAFSLEEFWHFG
jgi:hypothetical protein